MSRLRVSVIVIGDEILGGFVADTNSGWLAGRLQVIGVPLDRVVTVPDEYHAIDETLATELARSRPRLVITSGGIGSTPDDLTLESVAGHLGVSMRTEAAIDERITAALEWTAQQGVTVTEGHAASMRKMARVPAPAYLLPGNEGLVPGIAVDLDGGLQACAGATIVVLPGVPGELRRIMTEGVEPALLAGRGEPQHVAEVTHGYPESTLNPVLDRLVAEYPDVHVGSYPGAQCVIRLKGDKARVEAGMELVTDYLDGLATDPGAASLLAGWRARWA
ncbi:MAG: molybdopterin-binding protein [Actinomycetota bacterium]|jgi:nicotinamide-nucleotide amidase|nr:molybdopterin-binding protein [Actinomycetota bacterium]